MATLRRVLVVQQLLQEFPRRGLVQGELDLAERDAQRAPQGPQPSRTLQDPLHRVGQGPAVHGHELDLAHRAPG